MTIENKIEKKNEEKETISVVQILIRCLINVINQKSFNFAIGIGYSLAAFFFLCVIFYFGFLFGQKRKREKEKFFFCFVYETTERERAHTTAQSNETVHALHAMNILFSGSLFFMTHNIRSTYCSACTILF